MKNLLLFGLSLLAATIFFSSCGDDDDNGSSDNLSLNLNGLEDLGPGFAYEGWIIVDGAPVTTGVFTVDTEGNLSDSGFEIDEDQLAMASTFVLTVEPSPDADPAPSPVHILAGDFDGTSAALTVGHPAALNDDYTDAAGTYIVATPTDGADNFEESGIWFLDNSSGAPATGLSLATLPEGWAYEGWVVINGTPVSTGTFTSVDGADANAPFSGTMGGPPYPGEDFLNNAPDGLSFPTDIRGMTAVISIEPVPDNSAAPFVLKPLAGMIPAAAEVHSALSMDQNLSSFPTGSVSR